MLTIRFLCPHLQVHEKESDDYAHGADVLDCSFARISGPSALKAIRALSRQSRTFSARS